MSKRPDDNATHNRTRTTRSKDTIIDLLQEIAEILRASTIVEERGKDVTSKFWAAYKKVSSDYDDDMLERCNSNMDIVLIFAGLFSAANTAFIISMQPNPVDTTNILLAQLVQISLYGPSIVQPMTISSSTGYTSSDFWTQALAYASLAFSLLAAFGAVMGKQWLGYYKTNRYVRGSLEERCKQRHRKFQGLEKWWFEGVLQSFPDLLKFSLFLFGLSLGAAMWPQQQTISILIIATTAISVICYALTILASVLSPDCPFQTRVSSVIRDLLCSNVEPDKLSTQSAMEWLLRTSTNPDVIKSALELLPTISRKTTVDPVSLSQRTLDMFGACFDSDGNTLFEENALAYGKALIHLSQTYPNLSDQVVQGTLEWSSQVWKSWRKLYIPWVLEQCQTSYYRIRDAENITLARQSLADTRSALRAAVTAGLNRFSHPDNLNLLWDGRFQLDLELPDVRWLMECAEHFYRINDTDVAEDALLLFSGVLIEESICLAMQDHIPQFLTGPSPQRLRYIALRAALQSFLQSFNYMDRLRCEESLSHAVLEAIFPAVNHTIQHVRSTGNDSQFANATTLLEFTKWPEDSHLKSFPLTDIQLLLLFVLPVPKVDNLQRYNPYCNALARCIDAHDPSTLRITALRMARTVREDLAELSAAGASALLRDIGSDGLPLALLTILYPNCEENSVDANHDVHNLRFISTLAKVHHHHNYGLIEEQSLINTCIKIVQHNSSSDGGHIKMPSTCLFYLAGILLRIAPSERAASYLGTLTTKHWWDLMKGAWHAVDEYDRLYDDPDDILAALVTGTSIYMPLDASTSDLEVLRKLLGNTLYQLRSGQSLPDQSIISTVRGLKDKVRHRLASTGQKE